MTGEPARAGANPAQTSIPQATFAEALPARAVKEFIGAAAITLEKNLFTATRLLAACEAQNTGIDTAASRDAVKTTIRLLRIQREAAMALERVAKGETRHRIIVEFQGLPPGARGGLNSKIPPPSPRPALPLPEGMGEDRE